MTPERLAEIRSITEEAGAEEKRRGDHGILLNATRDLIAEVERLREHNGLLFDDNSRHIRQLLDALAEVERLRALVDSLTPACPG